MGVLHFAVWWMTCFGCPAWGQDFMGFLHLGWDTATQEELEDEPLASLGPAWEEASRCGPRAPLAPCPLGWNPCLRAGRFLARSSSGTGCTGKAVARVWTVRLQKDLVWAAPRRSACKTMTVAPGGMVDNRVAGARLPTRAHAMAHAAPCRDRDCSMQQ